MELLAKVVNSGKNGAFCEKLSSECLSTAKSVKIQEYFV